MKEKSTLYTRSGDTGTTSLVDGTRIKKNHMRVMAYGTVDELNSFLGLLLATVPDTLDEENRSFIGWVQNKLFNLGAYLATDNKGRMTEAEGFGQTTISRVEEAIDRVDRSLPALKAFILPGGSPQAAVANVCRTVCRRAERDIVSLSSSTWVDPNVIRFVNRLSDYLFAIGRMANVASGTEEITWKQVDK